MAEQRSLTGRSSPLEQDEALYDGIQPWMRNSVRDWLSNKLRYRSRGLYVYRTDLLHQIELQGRIFAGDALYEKQLYDVIIGAFGSDPDIGLDIVQIAVSLEEVEDEEGHYSTVRNSLHALNHILVSGGSKWHIVIYDKQATMEARVDTTTEAAYRNALGDSDYSPHLKRAWEACYGRSPSPSQVFTGAIKAVEAAAWKVISPNNSKATLGTLIADFKKEAEADKFATAFHDKEEGESLTLIVKMMEKLWHGQTDRHATGAYKAPSQEEAEIAIRLSVTLCHIFSSNGIYPNVDPTESGAQV